MACPEHQSKIVQRFHTGLQTQQQLRTDLDTTSSCKSLELVPPEYIDGISEATSVLAFPVKQRTVR